MRPVPVPTREELGEGGWIIAAAETVINSNSVEKRLNNVTAYSAEDMGGSMLQDRAI
jgi:hypothetical protein